MLYQENKDYIKGFKYGVTESYKDVLEHVIKLTTVKVAFEVVVWKILCELIDEKIPRNKRKDVLLKMLEEEVDKWI